MRVPLRPARRAEAAPADAYLLVGPLAGAARYAGRAALHPVAGGFVLVPRPGAGTFPGLARLRRVGGDLFAPADADPVPALLPDEIASLTAETGLLLLPGRVLAFDPTPLAPAEIAAPPAVRRGGWAPVPPRPPGADRLTTIEAPPPPADAVLEAPPAGPAERPPAPGTPASRAGAAAALGLGRILTALGRHFGSAPLARKGADLARRAIEKVPRLSEKVLGEQEAALRDVLRQLQAGDVERALRRAPIAVADPDAPARVDSGSRLGSRDPRFDLRSLLGGGGGAASGWLGGGDVWAALAAEYRKLAADAARRGDARRAAYLYGVLLRDPRAAANALSAGGLHREAAVVLRDRLLDEAAAAGAFEKAGDYDEALRLYEKHARFESAAELLRRLGEEGRARGHFLRAADEHAKAGRPVAAGDLARDKLGDRARAVHYYHEGWVGRSAELEKCGERLFDELAAAADWRGLRLLLADAEGRLATGRGAGAFRFVRHALAAGLPAAERDECADRGRRLLAGYVRAADSPVSDAEFFFGAQAGWPGPVSRDALYAAKSAGRIAAAPALPGVQQLATGAVRAVAAARNSGDLLVATDVEVVFWRAGAGRVVPVSRTGPRFTVRGAAVDANGSVAYVLRWAGGVGAVYSFTAGADRFAAQGSYTFRTPDDAPPRQAPEPGDLGGEPAIYVATGEHLLTLSGIHLRESVDVHPFPPVGTDDVHLLAVAPDGRAWEWSVDSLGYRNIDGATAPCDWFPHWRPGIPPGSPLATPTVSWAFPAPGVLEVAGVDAEGVLHFARFGLDPNGEPDQQAASRADAAGYRAACLLRAGRVAAVTGDNVLHVLRADVSGRLIVTEESARLGGPAWVAFLAEGPGAGELLAVFDDASATRVRVG